MAKQGGLRESSARFRAEVNRQIDLATPATPITKEKIIIKRVRGLTD